jgi:peptidoglycan/xylan/chitin deacetylase (PgdA/CDA1 family)
LGLTGPRTERGRDQGLGIGMEWTLEELLGGGTLQDLAQVHHGDAMTQIADGREVVRDQKVGHLKLRLEVLQEGGFLYDSDGYADDLPYFVDVKGKKWLVIPYSFETNDMKLWRPPGTSAPSDFFDYLKAAFDCLYEEGRTHPQMLSVGLHMRHIGRPGHAGALEEFVRYAKSFPGVWFARGIDIARWWLRHYSDLPALAS